MLIDHGGDALDQLGDEFSVYPVLSALGCFDEVAFLGQEFDRPSSFARR